MMNFTLPQGLNTTFLNFSSMKSRRNAPALLTPPPITTASMLTVHATLAIALASASPMMSITESASASPVFARSMTSFAVISTISRRGVGMSVFFIAFFASRTIPVALATSSRQSFLPQLQTSVFPGATGMCPISPAPPVAPATILPSRITPPPTPVPSVTISISE